MTDLTIFPADIAEMSVSQLAQLTPAQKLEVDVNLEKAIAWLKQARTKFDAALKQCYEEQAKTALLESGRDFGTAHRRSRLVQGASPKMPSNMSGLADSMARMAR